MKPENISFLFWCGCCCCLVVSSVPFSLLLPLITNRFEYFCVISEWRLVVRCLSFSPVFTFFLFFRYFAIYFSLSFSLGARFFSSLFVCLCYHCFMCHFLAIHIFFFNIGIIIIAFCCYFVHHVLQWINANSYPFPSDAMGEKKGTNDDDDKRIHFIHRMKTNNNVRGICRIKIKTATGKKKIYIKRTKRTMTPQQQTVIIAIFNMIEYVSKF